MAASHLTQVLFGVQDNVELYVNNTGLMWENAQKFNAMLVFAEHRYFGSSMPFGTASQQQLHYLTHEQALADFAHVIREVKAQRNAEASKVVAFGGSYGGMLAAWLRMKYPHSVDGAIAGSAPILAFSGLSPAWDDNSYWRVVTRDATAAAGAAPQCASNVRKAWGELFSLGKTAPGRQKLESIFGLCAKMQNTFDTRRLALLGLFAWDTMAMGNFPWPSAYLTHGQITLPAWPVRVACEHMAGPFTDAEKLLEGLSAAIKVFNNASGTETCFDLPADLEDDGIWDYIYCTETLPQETYFTLNGKADMFWDQPYNLTFINEHCKARLVPV